MTRAQQIRMPKTRRDADTYAVTASFCTVHALVGTNVTSQLLSLPASQLRFTWQGREYSHATGLYSFRARWYDPASGRWLSKDPIGLEGGLNLYEAFGNNPVCFVDPCGFSFWGSFAKGVVSGITSALTSAVIVTAVVAVVSIAVPVMTPVASCILTSALLTVGVAGALNTAVSIYNDPSVDNIGYETGKICGGTIVGLGPGKYVAQVISPVGNKPSAAGIIDSLKKDPSQIFIPQKGKGLCEGFSDCMSKGPTVGGAAMAIGICPVPNLTSDEEKCR